MKKLLFLLALASLLSACGSSSSNSGSNAPVDLLAEVDALMLTSTDESSEPVMIDNVVVTAPDNTEAKSI